MRRFRKRSGKDLTWVEKEALLKFINKTFTEDFWEYVGYSATHEGVIEVYDRYCHDMSIAECKSVLLKHPELTLYIKKEVKEREQEVYLEAIVDFRESLKNEVLKIYGTTFISDLYKKDVVKIKQEVCSEVIDYCVNHECYTHVECRDEYVDEKIDWNNLFFDYNHVLTQYIKEFYKCRDLYEVDMINFRLQLVSSEREVYTFTDYFAKTQGLQYATIPEAHLTTAKAYTWIITVKNTELIDKVLICDYGIQVIPIYDPLAKQLVEIREEPIISIITHKLGHVIGVISWNYRDIKTSYYAYVY